MSNNNNDNFDMDMLSETENFAIWSSPDDDNATIYHIELGSITLHLTGEEWQEFLDLIKALD
jgi:hypothetical protein